MRWSRPAITSSRSTPTRSRPAARATAATAPRATPRTPTCWPTCCAPTATAGGSCRRSPIRSAPCARWCARATTWWPPAWRWATSCKARSQTFWPGAACIFADITSSIGLAFLKRYPSPASAARLSEAALGRFCRSQHYSGRRSPAELLARLRSAAAGSGRSAHQRSGRRRWCVRWWPCCCPLVAQIAELTRRIERFVESLPDGQIIMSFPRAGHVCAAQILAELGDVRERFPSLDQLAAEAGAVPVTYQSGKTRSVAFRWACNHRLRQGHHLSGRQLASRQRVGARHLHRSACSWLRSSPCNSHPRASLAACHLARLDRPHYPTTRRSMSAPATSLPRREVDPGCLIGLPSRSRARGSGSAREPADELGQAAAAAGVDRHGHRHAGAQLRLAGGLLDAMRTGTRCTTFTQLPVAFCGGSTANSAPVAGAMALTRAGHSSSG